MISKSAWRRRRWSRTSLLRTSVLGLAALVAGLVPGRVQAFDGGEQLVEREYRYVCALAEGGKDVPVRVSAVFPQRAQAGKEIQPADVTVGVTLDPSVLAVSKADGSGDTAPVPPADVAGEVDLIVPVEQQGKPVEANWQGLVIKPTQVPATGDAELTASGTVPWVSTGSSGDVSFSAGKLHLTLVPMFADGTATVAGPIEADCTLAPGQDPVLTVVGVTSDLGGRPQPPRVSDPRDALKGLPQADVADAGEDWAAWPEGIPNLVEECAVHIPLNLEDRKGIGHGYLSGYSNVAKQKGAVLVSDALSRLELSWRGDIVLGCPPGSPQTFFHSRAKLDYNGKPQLPPARSTFLTYGFMPTTATVELTAEAPSAIVSYPFEGHRPNPDDPNYYEFPEETYVFTKLWIRIYDVKVNGAKLDVGANCRSVRPMNLLLKGKGFGLLGGLHGGGYQVAYGGLLTGTSTIPPFGGCGVHEDLDNIFTSAISGPGNYTKMAQGPLCVLEPTSPVHKYCPNPPRPDPER